MPLLFSGVDNSTFPSPRTNADAARAAFVAALGASPVITQDFESAALGNFAPLSTGPFANGVGVSLANTATDFLRITDSVGAFDTFASSGSHYIEALSDPGSTYFTATFDTAVRGIGFYVTDASDWACCGGQVIGKLKVVLTTAGGSFEVDLISGFEPTDLVDGNVAFFGVFDAQDPFTSIAIRSAANIPDEDAIGIDDVMISLQQVPAPATLSLSLFVLLPGMSLLYSRRQRRNRTPRQRS